ncbi:4328_t:CDS:2 [Ambispora gerdemannii]|uniref:4328_t:CDS:1 n=1 Tax=Ambispora gerdemannii TaxID=144530 RepID=A0A9N9GQ01_9GLOM|nr:4328_t:CDS:2 [Ambispora gerdemannii]
MPLSLFLVVDNNTRSRLVAQALVSDEITESYKWILEYTKKATMIEPLFTAFFISAKTYQKTSNLSFIANMKALSMTFSYAATACVKKVSINDNHNLLKTGIQTTSRVESLNSIVKCLLTASSSLCDLVDVLDARLQDETQWN